MVAFSAAIDFKYSCLVPLLAGDNGFVANTSDIARSQEFANQNWLYDNRNY